MEEGNTPSSGCQGKRHMAMKLSVIGAFTLLGMTAALSGTIDSWINGYDNTVSVIGKGRVEYQPDIAKVSFGVQIDKAPTAEKALADLSTKIASLTAAISATGIPAEDVQTESYTLSPQYDFPEGGVSNVSGYNANQQISVRVRGIVEDPDFINRVVAEAGRAGVNQVNGITFDTSDLDRLKQEARVAAINDAKRQSSALATAAGVELGDITGWYETIISSPDGPTGEGFGAGMDMAEGDKEVAPQISSGNREIVIEISVSYEIED